MRGERIGNPGRAEAERRAERVEMEREPEQRAECAEATPKSGRAPGWGEIFRNTLQSRAVTLCFLGMGGLLFGVILAAAGTEGALMGLLAAAYVTVILLWLTVSGLLEQRRIGRLERLIEELPEKYLLGEVLPRPVNSVERHYFRIMGEVSRSCVGYAEQARREKEEYCDYVESWIHEMRTPLTACFLILDNGGDRRKLRQELKRADNLTESILYYARLRTVEKDIKIRTFSAADIVEEAVKSQTELLMGAGIRVETEGDFRVSSDEKSLCFILKQLLINCAKYCPGCDIRIRAEEGSISVRDNGPGIPAHELSRVTERGFTGSHVKRTEKTPRSGGTGMGLYIVKELCARLGLTLEIRSEKGAFTCVTLTFDSLRLDGKDFSTEDSGRQGSPAK